MVCYDNRDGRVEMSTYSKVVILGTVTRDIDLRHTPSGMAVCDVGLAVNDRVKVNGEYKEEASFVDCSMFARTAEVASEYLGKGSQCLVEGRLKQDNWTDKDGGKRSKLKVLVDRLVLVGKKGDGDGQRGEPGGEEDVPWA
jgi:single-strand DNA-binding protein